MSGKSEDISVLLMVSQPIGTSNRCNVNSLENYVSICISSDLSDTQGRSAYDKVSVLPSHTNCTRVAQEELVHKPPTNVCGGQASKITNSGQSALVTKDADISPKLTAIESYFMAAVNRPLRNKGFSVNARKLMVAPWQSGTQKVQ